MAGYLGTKAVLLSTTAADVVGNAEIGGDLTVGGTADFGGGDLRLDTSANIYGKADNTGFVSLFGGGAYNSGAGIGVAGSGNASANSVIFTRGAYQESMRIDNSGNLLVGTATSPSAASIKQVLAGANGRYLQYSNTSAGGGWVGSNGGASGAGQLEFGTHSGAIGSETYSERMRIDPSGNLLVGKTSADNSAGATIKPDGEAYFVKSNNAALSLNRLSSDGVIQYFFKDTSLVGSIGTNGGLFISNSTGNAGLKFWAGAAIVPCNSDGSYSDNDQDLGYPTVRFNDIYATNGTIQTSDRNEKQDIDVLNAAETRVAVACKGLLRKFRWKDAVAEKGDDARIHFGIIAQDLRDAFTAEGLDAGRYAMFISNTWWETQTDVPAVAAVAEVLDDEGNVVTEAVEAKEAYTRTDTYETQAEAPEGATERTRLGVRYPELLAFIIGAM